MMKKITILSALLFSISSPAIYAAPFSADDPRALAMGGTGVSSGTSASASLYNPALLAAANKDEDFSFEIAVVAYLSDPDDLRTSIEDSQDENYFAEYDNARIQLQNNPTSQTARNNFRQTSINLLNTLDSYGDKGVELGGRGSLIVGVPSRKTGMALTIGSWTAVSSIGDFTDQDRSVLESLIEAAASNTPNNIQVADDYTSNIQVRGIIAGEIGISFAREFAVSGHKLAFGVTPKYVRARTFDFTFDSSQIDNAELSLEQGEKDSNGFTVDAGMARDYGNGWKVGFSVKNLIPQRYETAEGNYINIDPMARIGLSHHANRYTVAFDFDVTENDPIGFGTKTRYAGIGAEFDAWVLKLRTGYRHNFSDTDTSIVSVGLGLNIVGLHLDAAVAANPQERDVRAGAQLGFAF